jgi:hypothetical protein
VVQIGLTEVPRCGTDHEVLRAHRLDAAGIAEHVPERLGIESRS